MVTENRYLKLFQTLLKILDQDRARAEGAASLVDGYAAAILATRERIKEAEALAVKVLKSREGETVYFREVWPRIHGRLFYFQRAHGFLMERTLLAADGVAGLVRREELEAARFFRTNWEFWLYYTSGSPVIDGQFTREYSRGCIYDPLCMVIDPEGATLASYKAAWGLAYEAYKTFIAEQIGGSKLSKPKRKFRWLESRTAALELLKAQEETGSVEIDGVRATMAQLVEDFEDKYEYSLKDYNKLLYAATGRKIASTPYLLKLIASFNGRKVRLRK